MPTKIKTVKDPIELLNRICGYAESARRSHQKGNIGGAWQSLGYVESQIKQYKKVT
jgi:hypothetical protein